MKKRNRHAVLVYYRNGRLYVGASLATPQAFRNLDFVIEPKGGFPGLPEAMKAAEARALEAWALPEERRPYADDGLLIRTAGCKTYRAFLKGTVLAQLTRFPKESQIMVWVPTAREDLLQPTDYHQACDPKAPIEILAPAIQHALEGI